MLVADARVPLVAASWRPPTGSRSPGTLLLTTTLFLIVAAVCVEVADAGGWSLGGVVFGGVELTFFAANLTKVVHGGWLPLAHRRWRS